MLRRNISLAIISHTKLLCDRSSYSYDGPSAEETNREKTLRDRISRGMSFPQPDRAYGSSEPVGANASSSGILNAISSSGLFKPTPAASSGQQQSGQSMNFSDFFMFATGVIVTLYSGNIIYKRLTGGGDSSHVTLPMWVASTEAKAKYLLFCCVAEDKERNAIFVEFQNVCRVTPTANFFDWLDVRYPGWYAGRKYAPHQVLDVMKSAVTGANSKSGGQLARLLGSSLTNMSFGQAQKDKDRPSAIDNMIDNIASALKIPVGGYPPAPAPPPMQGSFSSSFNDVFGEAVPQHK